MPTNAPHTGSGPDRRGECRNGSEPVFSYRIVGAPIAKKRHRAASTRRGVVTFSDQKGVENRVKWELKAAWRSPPLTGPLSIELVFGMPIPQSASKKQKLEMVRNQIKHRGKPDVDNLAKFYLDAMNKLIMKDDSQVWKVVAMKIYATEPFTFIKVFMG